MANEKRLIDLDETMKAINDEIWWTSSEKAYFRSFLIRQKRVDAVEVVHGCWVNNKNDYPECDKCGYMPQYDPMIDDIWYSPYCPRCGARMMNGDENG